MSTIDKRNSKKDSRQKEIEEKWLLIKKEAIAASTPAMKRAINRSAKDVYVKTAQDYRAGDGTAAFLIVTAETLISERNAAKAKKTGKDLAVSPAKKTVTSKKTTSKKSEPKKSVAKKSAAKKVSAKSTTKKSTTKKASAKNATKKTVTKKVSANSNAKKSAAKK